ncbi:hypothetical protein E2C01_007699 [Portunus trituberculatus]|uniref:Uncharacterized protein n=1 Tax=Portunus trituberculatus TaxID=210409 RepID=A0A5B7D145_PORTR|nr:hypothetical protein [Portunus trituberculatus]
MGGKGIILWLGFRGGASWEGASSLRRTGGEDTPRLFILITKSLYMFPASSLTLLLALTLSTRSTETFLTASQRLQSGATSFSVLLAFSMFSRAFPAASSFSFSTRHSASNTCQAMRWPVVGIQLLVRGDGACFLIHLLAHLFNEDLDLLPRLHGVLGRLRFLHVLLCGGMEERRR